MRSLTDTKPEEVSAHLLLLDLRMEGVGEAAKLQGWHYDQENLREDSKYKGR